MSEYSSEHENSEHEKKTREHLPDSCTALVPITKQTAVLAARNMLADRSQEFSAEFAGDHDDSDFSDDMHSHTDDSDFSGDTHGGGMPGRQRPKRTPEEYRRLIRRILLSAAGIILALILGFVIYVGCLIAAAPEIDEITVSPTESATYIYDQEGNQLRKLTLSSSNRDLVSIREIPETLRQAVVAIEDERFYEHGGIDLKGIARAFWTGIRSGGFSEGASTITQQLIKNSVFPDWIQESSFHDRFRRKVQEQYLALRLERVMSKEDILENYLNIINLGSGCYGVQSAAKRYFGKPVSDLTLSEATVIAAIPQNPTGYNPISHPENNSRRRQIVLTYMVDQGFISEEEREQALADNVYDRIREFDAAYEESSVYSYYEDALIEQVIEALTSEKGYTRDQAHQAVFGGGLRIISAQDARIQEICDEEFLNADNFPAGTQYGVDYALSLADAEGLVTHYGSEDLRSYVRAEHNASFQLMCQDPETAEDYAAAFRESVLATGPEGTEVLAERLTLSPQPQASAVILDQKTGFVQAVVGGRGEKTASLTLNRATETTRQPGSTFKILTAYAPALDVFGQTLATQYENEPYRYEDGTPVSNWDLNDYSGAVTIRDAITRSVNVAAVKCITEISPLLGFQYAQEFGISTLHEQYESNGSYSSDIVQPLALGGITQGVTNLELCGAYAAIANGGVCRQPKFFTQILDRHGNVLIDYTDAPEDTGDNRVLKDTTAYLLTSAMEDVVSSETGTAYGQISAGAVPVAGKTGTTSSYKDIWFTGYTPYYTCSVWGGYDNNESLPDGAAWHSYNKMLWTSIMTRVHASLPAVGFERPADITERTLCRESGLPAIPDGCPQTYREVFAAGTEPAGACPLHEPIPETEPHLIYQDILDQLLPETERTTESETDTENETLPGTEAGTEAESSPGAPGESELPDQPEQESSPGGAAGPGQEDFPDSGQESESGSETQYAPQPQTSSLDDMIEQLRRYGLP